VEASLLWFSLATDPINRLHPSSLTWAPFLLRYSDETFAPFRWQTEKKEPFPTLTRRAQFYIDHEWFLEAGEELPVHKEAPAMGGNHPFVVTSGHMRSSVNGMHSTDRTMLATTRGTPVAHINDRDAAARGIENGNDIRVFNDEGSMIIQARVTPTVRPGQVIVYTGLESYMHPEWKSLSYLETGMVKYLLLAGGYGHLRYRPLLWQPVPIDRGVRVDYEKVTDNHLTEAGKSPAHAQTCCSDTA